MPRIPWLHIVGRGIGIFLMLTGFLHSPRAFCGAALGAFLLYIFGEEPQEPENDDTGNNHATPPAK